MTKKNKLRNKDNADIPLKQSGYCEICQVDYANLADHERSPAHLNFAKNCSNFLELDTLIGNGADVEAFLKMNKAPALERRSLRSVIRPHQEDAPLCNGVRNGSLSPRSPRINGRAIRWRKPSPETAPPPAYYKVVGMSTKLRSSSNFNPTPPPPTCNGDANPGLVVKFRRVRRSELSVLSDEAENFMFPKKDDSDTEDDSESRGIKKDAVPTNGDAVKEEEPSGDDVSQDSCGSDFTRRNPRRRTHVESYKDTIDYYGFDFPTPRQRQRTSKSPEVKDAIVPPVEEEVKKEEIPAVEKCLIWEEGRLRASDRVENLTYTFERVPNSEPWYDTFRRQDEGKEKKNSIIRYLNYFPKSPILPYEMHELPPLKPNCCILSQIKKPHPKVHPSRSYGTRGMKKKKIKSDPVLSLSLNPRKSPREHASTLAILGGLVHRKRSKLSGSEDSKSLPSIAEEDVSSDATPALPNCKLFVNPIEEANKQIDALLSSVCDYDDEYDLPLDSLECGVKIEKSASKPNIVELLGNYEECETLENTVREIHENVQPVLPKKRKGHKFKKKNMTGWPNKRKYLKKDTASTVGSTCSSRDASAARERKDEDRTTATSPSDVAETESDDERAASPSSKVRGLDLQPVVRVLKMEESTARKLRSAAARPRLRRRPHR